MTIPAWARAATAVVLVFVGPPYAHVGRAQAPANGVPLARGVTIVQSLHFPEGDRESIVTLKEASPAGVRYLWQFVEVHSNGDTIRFEHATFVSAVDLAEARRVHFYEETAGPEQHPGYTAFSLSTAIYRKLRTEGSDTLQIMSVDHPWGISGGLAEFRTRFGGAREVPIRWRGTVVRTSAALESFPLLVNGRRVAVPALHLRGRFTASRERRWEPEIWVLADSAHPLFLKLDPSAPNTVFQTVRVDLPAQEIEGVLGSACRVELPGVYFGFNSAELDPASDRAIGSLAGLLARHPDWNLTIEGHTDSIGSATANQALSQRRAEAVRDRLVTRHRVDARRLGAMGFGRSKPREPNTTIEGRARNRRVELARDCGGRTDKGGTP
jgi:outer membrane protein OmpA-like peptidoglycan-associated protein